MSKDIFLEKEANNALPNSSSDLGVSCTAVPSINVHGGNAQIIISPNNANITQSNLSANPNAPKLPKRILVLSANPRNTAHLRLSEEVREICDGLERSRNRDDFQIAYSPATRIKDIRRKMLDYKPHIVHFCGHGAGHDGIVFENDAGDATFVSADVLAGFFQLFKDHLECVVLNACYSEVQASTISNHIKYVIGMNEAIDDKIAIEFSVAFYDAIYANYEYETAYKVACNAIKWFYSPNSLVPVFLTKRSSEDIANRTFRQSYYPNISPSRLPWSGQYFVGRSTEISLLDGFLGNPKTNVASIVAWGGEGKSALISYWRSHLASCGWMGIDRVFDWSFHSQGNMIDRPVSSEAFIDAALRWFGDTEPEIGSSWQKGERLAKLVQSSKTLLFLDGLEPLQYYSNRFSENGRLRDPAISVLIRMLADYNPGLCIITTRLKISDLDSYDGGTCETLTLKGLPALDSEKLLMEIGVKGTRDKLTQIANKYNGHALSINLVGHYILDALNGSIGSYIHEELLEEDSVSGNQAGEILISYEKWFGDSAELQILHLLGLFDRPATTGEIAVLKQKSIKNLTDKLYSLSAIEWNAIIRRLSQMQLVNIVENGSSIELDAHPLIREYFAHKLRIEYPEAWKVGNYNLYLYWLSLSSTVSQFSSQLDILFQAVSYGCKASLQQEVYSDIYEKRIKQGEFVHDARILGGYSTKLEAVAGFFDHIWDKPSSSLNAKTKIDILAEASFAIRSFGIFDEAVDPLREAIELSVGLDDYRSATMYCSNLAEVYMILGNEEQALLFAKKGAEYVKNTQEIWKHNWILKAKTAEVISKFGQVSEADVLYSEAEVMQAKYDSTAPRFYGVLAFKHFDFLLAPYETEIFILETDQPEVAEKIIPLKDKAILASKQNDYWQSVLHIALGKLTIARIDLLLALCGHNIDKSALFDQVNSALSELKSAGRQEYLPFGLIVRSRYYRTVENYSPALNDLQEAIILAQQGHMRLHEFSILVEFLHLYLNLNDKENAVKILSQIQALRNITGFKYKDHEINLLEERLNKGGAVNG